MSADQPELANEKPAVPPRAESRRGFIRGSSLWLAGALPSAALANVTDSTLHDAGRSGEPSLRVGLVGCGYRGIAACNELLETAAALDVRITLTALADTFPDRLQQALRTLRSRHGDRVDIPASSRHVGLHAYQGLLASEVDLVLLATPPVFRPAQFAATVAHRKHVVVELPIAVDGPGVEHFSRSLVQARQSQLVVSATCLPQLPLRSVLALDKIQLGIIGAVRTIWAAHRPHPQKPAAAAPTPANLEWQLRNWMHLGWASGGALVERRARSLGLVNYLLQAHPCEVRPASLTATNVEPSAGKLSETEADAGLEFRYADGTRLISYGRPDKNSAANLAVRKPAWGAGKGCVLAIEAEQGWCDLYAGIIYARNGDLRWSSEQAPAASSGTTGGPWVELLSELRQGGRAQRQDSQKWVPAVDYGLLAAQATQTALLGRLAHEQQRRVVWEEACLNQAVFDSIHRPAAELGVDPLALNERYLAGLNLRPGTVG